ncbi:TolC family outer membrane protein [Paludibacterium purpuratum]|uniref:Outer membrane protein n=1 Tax=Paludibacterium purpuratum TaxID=1144873 RepID=A0A4R7B6A6_9NEIS|nr:TolC family outer membrane protein [Paludibacterium purpuratum]TDR78490.1 outer membrane protein [Paludibacterium purpuratum]
MKSPAALTLSLMAASLAAPAFSFDLMEAWQAARQYDAGYAAARSDYRAGQEQGALGRAQLLPQVNLTGTYSQNHPINQAAASGSGSDPGGETHGFGVNLTQPLFDGARLAQYRKGRIGQAQADTTLDGAGQQLIADVAAAYFNVLQAQDTLAATEIAKKAYASQLAQAKTEFEIGTATITNTNEAQAGYDSAVADEIQAQSDLELNRNALARLTGLSPLALQPLVSVFPLDRPSPDNLDNWLEQAQRNSLKIRAKEQAVAQAEQNLAEKRSGHLPVVQLTASYQDNTTNDPASTVIGQARTRGSTIGVSVTVPLFAGGGINAQVREAAAQLDSARDQLLDTQRQVREDVRRAWLGVTNGAASVRAQGQRLTSAKSKLDSTQLGREVGIRTNLDLLKAQQEYSDVLKDLAAARYRFLNAQLQLAQAAGQLDEQTLARVNRAIRH